ncbi:MAG: tripartite tricarboxylate transporter substrate binding protein [Pelistega sp.]|nr:tripartite tricarboxylate transporter substrate binding protein [Pelistega sp.]
MKKHITHFILGLIASATTSSLYAQTIPPVIHIVVPSTAGASTDLNARIIAKQLGERLGNTVVVDNRPGGSGMIGARQVARGAKDGSTLLFSSVSLFTTSATSRKSSVDVNKELTPIAISSVGPLVIAVSTKTNIKTPADLLAAAKANPDEITHGTAGVGTIAHLATELLNESAHIKLKHIPYKGASLAVTDASGGTIDMVVASNSTFDAQIKAGRMRAIAVTSNEKSPSFPNLETMNSVVPGYTAELWTAMFVPTGTPPELITLLNKEINEILQSKEILDYLSIDGATPLILTPKQVKQFVDEKYEDWKKIAKEKDIILD